MADSFKQHTNSFAPEGSTSESKATGRDTADITDAGTAPKTADPTTEQIAAAAAATAWAAMEQFDKEEGLNGPDGSNGSNGPDGLDGLNNHNTEGPATNLPHGYSADAEHVTGATAIVNQAIAEADEFDNAAVKARLQPVTPPDNANNPHLFQAHTPSSQPIDAPHLRVLGHWYYDQNQGFLLDEVTATIFAIDDYHEWHDPQKVLQKISSFDAARFWLTMKLRIMGDIVFEKITFTQGPYNGQCFIVQGSVLARDKKSQAICATGYISHESSPYSEFIPREISGDGMFLINIKTDEMIGSASFHRMLGYSAEEFPKTNSEMHEKLLHPDDIDVVLVQNQIVTTNIYGDYYESCVRLKHKNGHYIWTIGRALVLDRDEKNVATQLIGTQTDINLVQTNFDNMKLMMFNDSLTGLHNRTYFQQNALRYDDPELQPLSVLFVDVTGLKLTNDILGHSYGDYLIIKTCEIIRQALSEELSEMLNARYNDQEEVNNVLSELNSSLQSNSKYESQDKQHLNYLLETQTPNDPPNFDLFDVYQQALQTNTDTARSDNQGDTNIDAASSAADFFAMDPSELDRASAEDPAANSTAADFFAMDPAELDPSKAATDATGGNAADFFAMDPAELDRESAENHAAYSNAANFFAMDPSELDPSKTPSSQKDSDFNINNFTARTLAKENAALDEAKANIQGPQLDGAAARAKRSAFSSSLVDPQSNKDFDINAFTAKTLARANAATANEDDEESDDLMDKPAFLAQAKPEAPDPQEFYDPKSLITLSRYGSNSSQALGIGTKQSIAATSAIESTVSSHTLMEEKAKTKEQAKEQAQEQANEIAIPLDIHTNILSSKDYGTNQDVNPARNADNVGATQAQAGTDDNEKEQQRLRKLQQALISSGLDILRLAGDEFLVILPNCPMQKAQEIAEHIKKVRDAHNAYHEQHTPIEERSVPVYFGVGVASYNDTLPAEAPEKRGPKQAKSAIANAGEKAPKDNIKQIIARADARMQADKEAYRIQNYSLLKEYFEEKKGRTISMRDDRRYSYLSKDERQSIRTQSNKHYIL